MPPHDGPKSDGADVRPSLEDLTDADLEANEFFVKGGPPLQSPLKSVNVVRLLFMRLARHVWRNPEITIFRLLWLVFTAVCIGACVAVCVARPLLCTRRDGERSLARACTLRVCACSRLSLLQPLPPSPASCHGSVCVRAYTRAGRGGESQSVDEKHIRASEPSGTEDGDPMVEFLGLSQNDLA
jgi:hypothetical protein